MYKNICKQCGKEILTKQPSKVYCNTDCRKLFRKLNSIKKGWTEQECPICKKKFIPNSGSQKYCLVCRKEVRKEQGTKSWKKYDKVHPERRQIIKAKWRAKHPYSKLTREEKDKENTRKRLAYDKDLKLARKKGKKRYAKWVSTEHGRNLNRARNWRRRAKEALLIHSFTTTEWEQKKASTNGICPGCAVFVGIENLTLDHIVPISKAPDGFEYTIKDVQPLCESCNKSKGDKQ